MFEHVKESLADKIYEVFHVEKKKKEKKTLLHESTLVESSFWRINVPMGVYSEAFVLFRFRMNIAAISFFYLILKSDIKRQNIKEPVSTIKRNVMIVSRITFDLGRWRQILAEVVVCIFPIFHVVVLLAFSNW